jgi:tight adherence protein B
MTFPIAALGALGLLLVYDGIAGGRARTRPSLMRRLDELSNESGIRGFTGARMIALAAGAGLVAFVITAAITKSLAIAVALAVGAARIPFGVARSRRQHRRARFREAWPDAIATLVASVRAGISLPEACVSLTERGPRELAPGFESFRNSYRSSGSFAAGLHRLREDLADPIADRVATALLLAHEVGGTDLVRVLRTLGDFVREDLRVRKEIEARWSWTVTAARVAAAAPWVVLVMMASRPEAASAYNTGTGVMVIVCGAAATFAGYRLMLRAARLPEQRRLT